MDKPIPSSTTPGRPSTPQPTRPSQAKPAQRGDVFAALLACPIHATCAPPAARGLHGRQDHTAPGEPREPQAESLALARRDDDREARDHRDQGPRRLDRALDSDVLAPFVPPPNVLSPPSLPVPESLRAADVASRVDAAALAEKLVRSMRVGRVGDGHEVRLRLAASAGHGDVEVRLRHEGGELHATLVSHDGGAGVEQLAEGLARELSARGLAAITIEVEGR